ncbi:hypothetical protein EAI_10447 [Harpegnathos saltator]|uniref:Uncharacterized protein n=1 Tax=Harpegnathos saltator TaxID=610380 RepID=E2C584_HARSA|nr:hypothetical protein EAI_10447 [Harpegnathos saltator]
MQPTISLTPSMSKQYDPLEELDALETPRTSAKAATETKKAAEKAAEKKPANSGSSWFGGLFSKLAPKPKNQMILPDDSNPTGRSMRANYVDVMNPGGSKSSTASSNMPTPVTSPLVPMATSSPQLFVPMPINDPTAPMDFLTPAATAVAPSGNVAENTSQTVRIWRDKRKFTPNRIHYS